MKDTQDIKAFKNELRNYHYYEHKISVYTDRIESCYDLLGASPKSPNLQDVTVHTPRDKDFEYRIRDEITLYEAKRSLWQGKKDYVDEILSRMEINLQKDVFDVYANGKSLIEISGRRYITASTLTGRINRGIAKAVRE